MTHAFRVRTIPMRIEENIIHVAGAAFIHIADKAADAKRFNFYRRNMKRIHVIFS